MSFLYEKENSILIIKDKKVGPREFYKADFAKIIIFF